MIVTCESYLKGNFTPHKIGESNIIIFSLTLCLIESVRLIFWFVLGWDYGVSGRRSEPLKAASVAEGGGKTAKLQLGAKPLPPL